MDNHVLALASHIIQRSNRLKPADAVLRDELKNQRQLSPRETGQISAAVFAYFRWFGWLNQKTAFPDQVRTASELADRFARNPGSFSDAELIKQAVPSWLVREMEISASWVRSLQTEPKLWLRARPGQGSALAAKLETYTSSDYGREREQGPAQSKPGAQSPVCIPFGKGPLSDSLEFRGETDLFRTSEFHTGEFELQDITSQAVGLICAPAAGQVWWDACAGEGGKALHLCDLMGNQGLVWASDRADWRLKKLKRRAARARIFNYRARVWDGGSRLPVKTKFDGVLVDAPCSGVGTWQRNPHARWTTTLSDIHELGELQVKLLSHAAASVKPGGKLFYSVCTLPTSETVSVAERFEVLSPEFKPFPLSDPLGPEEVPSARLRLLPQHYRGNAMFIAAWKRG